MLFEATIDDVHTKALKVGSETRILLIVETTETLCGILSVLTNKRVFVSLHPKRYEAAIDVQENGETVFRQTVIEPEDVGEQVAEAVSAPCAVCGHEEALHSRCGIFCDGDEGKCQCTEYVRPESAAETIDILTGAILGTEPGGPEDDEAREMVKEILGEDKPAAEAAAGVDGLTVDDMIASALTQGMVEKAAVLSGGVAG